MTNLLPSFCRFTRSAFVIAAVITAITAPATAAAVDMFVKPSSTVPADKQEIASSVGVDNISIIIPGGGVQGIESLNERGATVTILKDDLPFETLSSLNGNEISFDPADQNGIILHTGLLTEPGTYTVTLPEKLVKMAIDTFGFNGGSDESVPPTYYNKEYTFTFTIVEMPSFSISPEPGLYLPSEILEFRVSFPEGAEVKCNADSRAAALWKRDVYTDGGAATIVTEYSCRAEGNVLVLTAKNPDRIKGLEGSTNRSWDYVEVAKDAVTVTLDGKEYHNPPLVFQKYDVRTIGEEGFTISPSLSDNLLPGDLKEFIVGFPANITFDTLGEVGATAAYLKQVGVGEESRLKYSGLTFAEYEIVEIDTQRNTMRLRMKQPESEMAYVSNPANMETGYYCFSFAPRVFYKKSTLNFPGYGVTGKEGGLVTGATLVMANGNAHDSLTLEKGQSFAAIELYFNPFNIKRSAGSNLLTLIGNGQEVWSGKVSTCFSTSYDNYVKINFGKSFTQPGEYILTIPAGSFMQKGYGDYKNLEQKITISILDPTGVEEIEESGEDYSGCPVEYYTLAGVRVAAEALIPGAVYIRKQGARAEKVVL